jgi:phosphopantetheine--protein transferase-like protein
MAGEERMSEVVAYVGRLMGETISADQAVKLRSVQRAAFSSWARQQGVKIRLALIGTSAPFSVRELLTEDNDTEPAVQTIPAPAITAGTVPFSPMGLGLDIEEVDNLPEALDYREHPFFQDNFTPAEVAYCIRQADVKASFCGTWAAKEAILKSGLVTSLSGRLREIEITRDRLGRPVFPQCSLSISHTARTAVAVCLAVSTNPLSMPIAPSHL